MSKGPFHKELFDAKPKEIRVYEHSGTLADLPRIRGGQVERNATHRTCEVQQPQPGQRYHLDVRCQGSKGRDGLDRAWSGVFLCHRSVLPTRAPNRRSSRPADAEFLRLYSLVQLRSYRAGGKVALVLLPHKRREIRRPPGSSRLRSIVLPTTRRSFRHPVAENHPHQQNLRRHEKRILDL